MVFSSPVFLFAFLPAVLLIHPVHGLIPFMEVLADRLAAQGYVALAPALYARLGTLTTDASGGPTEAAWELARQTPDQQGVADLRHALDYLAGLPTVGGKVGAIGFCAGGRYGLFLAAADRLGVAPAHAAVMTWIVEDGLSHGEIGQLLGRTPGATREFISQCRKRARHHFAEWYEMAFGR